MKKIFNFCMIALVAMVALNSCSEDCDHNFIEHDYTNDLVGTWTSLNGELAEAMVIKADGSFTTTGVMKGGSLYEETGTIKVVNNKVTLAFDSDKETFEGRLELVAGKSLSLVMFDDNDVRLDYDYCKEDLSDEIVGMWVCYDGPTNTERDMLVQVYQNDGYTIKTGWSDAVNDFIVNNKTTYKVVGDLIFYARPTELIPEEMDKYVACRIDYLPNGLSYGDKKTVTGYIPVGDDQVKVTGSWLRIKQSLDLANNSYDYSNIYVSNVKAKDAEFEFAGQTLNLANMDGRILDKMMKTLLFNVSFPSADKIVYNYHYNGENVPMPSPIVVDGNKMTIKKSVNNPACKDIDVWTFQDQDNTQMHMYMPVKSFENFLANTVVEMMANEGKLDLNDAAAVKAIFDQVEAAIETINVSFIFKTAK